MVPPPVLPTSEALLLTSSMLPPPPMTPPMLPPIAAYLAFTATLETTLGTFDEASFEHSIAMRMRRTEQGEIEVAVLPAGARVTVFIGFRSPAAAEEARPELEEMLATPAYLESVIGVGVAAVSQSVLLVNTVALPPAYNTSPPAVPLVVRGGLEALTRSEYDPSPGYVMIGGASGLVLLIFVLAIMAWRHWRKTTAKAVMQQAATQRTARVYGSSPLSPTLIPSPHIYPSP